MLTCSSKHHSLILWIAIVVIALAGCTRQGDDAPSVGLSLRGAWLLRHVKSPIGCEHDYRQVAQTRLRIYGDDNKMYECLFVSDSTGVTIMPSDTAIITLINEGVGNYLYFEDSYPRPLTLLNDSTITIQHTGVIYTWVRTHSIPAVRIEEIRRCIANDKLDDDNPRYYVFSVAEEKLRETNSAQAYIIAGTLVVLVAVAFLARDAIRRRRLVEQQLKQLTAEREQRPQLVSDALKSVETEFFGSDYYKSLCAKIKKGKIANSEWDDMSRRLDSVYPGFTSKLFGLYKMSDVERHVCLLLKLRISPSEIADALCRNVSSVSSIRSRLFFKVFGRKGSAKDWDEFILSL